MQEDQLVDLPAIISVDDHVLEPPTLWTDRLPKRYLDRGPRIVRERGFYSAGMGGAWVQDPDGALADVWYYDDLRKPLARLFGAAGFDTKSLDWDVTVYEDLRPGCYVQKDRLADMDTNHVEASLCFPNTLPRFCGQTFAEREDKELALLCVRAYNDWMIDEWAAGDGHGRLIPVTIVPLWDPVLAAEEIRRCAAKGSHAVTFSENPHALGLPSLHSGEWDPFLAACEETETTICLHIGSSSRVPTTSPDAPAGLSSILMDLNAAGSILDFVLGGLLHKFPGLVLAYSESNVGWMPYIFDRMDKMWMERGRTGSWGMPLPELPSSYLPGRIYGCILDDSVGVALRDRIHNQICFEADYPHADSKWPHSMDLARKLIVGGGMSQQESYDFLRGNAIKAFGLHRFGVTS